MTDLDPDLLQSLELFNARLEESAVAERAAKVVAKAERRKDEAAGRVRKLNDDPKATADEKAEAESAYRAAVAELAARTEDPFGTTAAPDTEPATPPAEDIEAAEDPQPESPSAEGGEAAAESEAGDDPQPESASAEGGKDIASAEGAEPTPESESGEEPQTESGSAEGGEDMVAEGGEDMAAEGGEDTAAP